MKNYLVKAIRKPLTKLGLNVYTVNESFVDFSYQYESPRLVTVYGKPVIMMANIQDSRWKANGCPINIFHPLVRILREKSSSKNRIEFEKAIRREMFEYYKDYQPTGLWECIGIEYSSKFDAFPLPRFTNNPPWPWSLHRYENNEKTAILENGKLIKSLVEEHGVQHWGPSSKVKIEAEIIKFGRLYESIRKYGFRYFPSDPSGVVLADILINKEGEWVWMVEQGQHRVMMCAALGINAINIKMRRVLAEDSIGCFPHVADGIYTFDEAKSIFRRVIGDKSVSVKSL